MKKILTVLAALIVLAIIIAGIVLWISGEKKEEPTPPPTPPAPEAMCPRYEVLSAPGTWESAKDDDPITPSFNPQSFMLSITQPIQAAYAPDDVKVWTLPYTAEFKNIQSMGEKSYDVSREEGTATLLKEMEKTHSECPQTPFILAGFSQGAVIMGDVASEIGNGRASIPAESIAGVTLIADGRRESAYGQVVGNPVAGVGAEIALHPVNALIQPIVPQATMRGTRAGGFGELDGRVNEICAPDDSICDAPIDVENALGRAQALIDANGVHAMYATNPNVIPGTTANQWTVDWMHGIING
ncbi:cutinase family protein [Corynebacterium glucuronolyticum]|uniref:cutinase family protein n=1 Tax=Corynebacterium glucuronolyticum TaxID=39791 RepID=UPI00019C21C0|nr:cutinase family protein [Corynebacterium glucuronolyticum]EEI26209.1 Cutinase [Corynebacterium glucuronolyticum ATCC 51867]QRO82340.1 cutinase family protein [Corynebacterium glucuronolyticum]